ncbi:MAG: formate dehydrogenase subunit delta [Gammaproteobacteria bacterium]|nr:MAG: formate dehydrogenase subunit delta [Gammaproteobacteria bacterium]
MSSSVEHLIAMANDIANFFRSEPDHLLAVEGVVNHLQKFWDPRMRRKIVAHLNQHGGEGLSELARAAVVKLAAS